MSTDLTKHKQKIIKWVNGKPVPIEREILSKEAVSELPIAVMSTLYKRTPLEIEFNIDEQFEGMTNGEVMMLQLANDAARGSHRATEMILDRILGKPKMVAETKNINLNYTQILEKFAEEDESESTETTIDTDAYEVTD